MVAQCGPHALHGTEVASMDVALDLVTILFLLALRPLSNLHTCSVRTFEDVLVQIEHKQHVSSKFHIDMSAPKKQELPVVGDDVAGLWSGATVDWITSRVKVGAFDNGHGEALLAFATLVE